MFRVLLIALLMSWVAASHAFDRGTPDEAKTLAERAAAYLSDHLDNPAAALRRLSAPSTEFVDRDLYVFVVTEDGKLLAHGINARIVGKDLSRLRDVDGQLIVINAIKTAMAGGAGWTPEYRFPDPLTDKIGIKQSYVVHVDNMVVGVGFYTGS